MCHLVREVGLDDGTSLGGLELGQLSTTSFRRHDRVELFVRG